MSTTRAQSIGIFAGVVIMLATLTLLGIWIAKSREVSLATQTPEVPAQTEAAEEQHGEAHPTPQSESSEPSTQPTPQPQVPEQTPPPTETQLPTPPPTVDSTQASNQTATQTPHQVPVTGPAEDFLLTTLLAALAMYLLVVVRRSRARIYSVLKQ